MSVPNDPTVSMVDVADTTVSPSGGGDVSVIITVAACIGGLFLVVLIVFIIFVIYFYRKQLKDDEFDKKSSLRVDRLDWKTHPLAQQFGDIDDIDQMLWMDRGRDANAKTDNPAFDKDFEPLDVDNLRNFDSADDDAISTRETESSSDLVEIAMEDEQGDTAADGDDTANKKQISILDMNTWGQPGSSRRNSMQSFHGFPPPPSFSPKAPDAISNGRNSLRSQNGNPFPYASPIGINRHNPMGSQGGFPFTVSQPSNDPRFQYTRTNPLMAEAVGRDAADRFSGENDTGSGYTAHKERDFGGVDDIESVEFDRSSTLRSSRRNQSVVDLYESGTRTTGSSFSLALEGSGSVGKNMLWQNKQFGGMGFANTK